MAVISAIIGIRIHIRYIFFINNSIVIFAISRTIIVRINTRCICSNSILCVFSLLHSFQIILCVISIDIFLLTLLVVIPPRIPYPSTTIYHWRIRIVILLGIFVLWFLISVHQLTHWHSISKWFSIGLGILPSLIVWFYKVLRGSSRCGIRFLCLAVI